MARRNNRSVTFWRERDYLHRTVARDDGKHYAHTCTMKVYQEVAHTLEESTEPTTLLEIAQRRELLFTQVNVALEFLKERGLIEIVRRRSQIASKTFFEDAMCEFHALTDADKPNFTV
jgi:hypothetical protein